MTVSTGDLKAASGALAPPSAVRGAARGSSGISKLIDVVFRRLCQAAAMFVIVLLVLLLSVLVWQAWPAIHSIGLRFFTSTTWDPEPTHRQFGALAFIWGTVATSAIAMLIAVPLGVGTAAFLSEIAPGWMRRKASFLVEMLAAVPSVVYGFWGLFVLAPELQKLITAVGGPNQGGVGILSAGLLLSIMIVPYVTTVSYDACQAVPRAQREGALALGATRWQTIRSVVLPYARPGIIGGCFLALGRALGETMAVTMLIGNRSVIDFSPFALGNSIASVIANEFTEAAYELYLSALVELGLVLLLVSVVINSFARLLIWRVGDTRPRRGLIRPLLEALAIVKPQAADVATPVETSTASPRSVASMRTAVSDAASSPKSFAPRRSAANSRRIQGNDRIMTGILGSCLLCTVGPLFFILTHLVYEGVGALNWDFFVNLPAPVGRSGGGMANALFGSFMLVSLATLFAVPIGLLAAVYLTEFRSDRLAPVVRFIGELLSGVPSIVIGIFAYHLIVRSMGHFSGWAGAFALGVMMIPIVMRASEEALKMVPQSIRDAGYALGANHSQTVLRVVVPAALPAIITAVFLAVARIGGETAPLLLTASGNQYWPTSPNDFTPSVPVYIFTYAVSPYDDWHRQAWSAALVLLAAVMLLNFGIRILAGKRLRPATHSG